MGVSTRLQLAYLNLLNIALASDDVPLRVTNTFTSDQNLVTDLVGFLDHGMTILRAKALVALGIYNKMIKVFFSFMNEGFLSRKSYRCLLWGCSIKLLPAVERIEKEKEQDQKDVYLKQCCFALTDIILEAVHSINGLIASDLRAVVGGDGSGRNPSLRKILQSPQLKSLRESIQTYLK